MISTSGALDRTKKSGGKKLITHYNERLIDVTLRKTVSQSVLSLSLSGSSQTIARVIDDRRVTPPGTCGTEDESNM